MPRKSVHTNAFNGSHEGKERSFELLFKEFYPTLVWFAFSLMKDKTVAEEIAEDSFIKLWERGGVKDWKTVKSFLYTITRNQCLNRIRDNKRNLERMEDATHNFEFAEDNFIEQVIRAELIRDLHSSIEKLPPQCRKIFKMLYIEGKDIRETAEILKIAPSTVYNQQVRGISLLKKYVSPFIIFFLFHS